MLVDVQPPTPHDALVRAIFSDPEHAAGELRHVLDPAFAARVDWSGLRLVSGSYVDDNLRGRHTDLLFSARYAATSDEGESVEVLIYLLFEHQSTDDPLMPFRLLLYIVRVWEKVVRETPSVRRLPAILPIVLHHSERGWVSPTTLHGIIDLDPPAMALVGKHIPQFEMMLDDLSKQTDDGLRARAISALGRLALFCLRHAREPQVLLEQLGRWLDLIREIQAAPGGREALVLIWRYILVTNPSATPDAVVAQLLDVVGVEHEEEVMTAGEQLIERGRKDGLEKGLEKGMKDGLEKGMKAAGEASLLEAPPRPVRRGPRGRRRQDPRREQRPARRVVRPRAHRDHAGRRPRRGRRRARPGLTRRIAPRGGAPRAWYDAPRASPPRRLRPGRRARGAGQAPAPARTWTSTSWSSAAGVNGLGVARDASKRGLKVVLFERNDLAFGASGNSSGMIHGGARYLTYDPHVTETSCRDSGHIQAIAPHLLFRIPFLMPVENTRKGRFLFPLMDAFFAAYDQYQPLKRGKPHARLTPDELRALEPGIAGDLTGGFSFDEWGIDGARLCVANAVDAMERGARIYVGTTVERIERAGPAASRRARRTGYTVALPRPRHAAQGDRIRAAVVVNATGAWAPITASLAGLPPERARVRPGKGIHVVYDRRLTNYAIFANTIDGRQIFLEPWENMSVLGTTDDDFYGDLDRVHATSEEVRYLVEGIARVFPAIHEARAIGTYAGVRPTLYAFGPTRGRALARARDRRPRRARRARHLLDDRRQAGELPPLRRGDGRRPRARLRPRRPLLHAHLVLPGGDARLRSLRARAAHRASTRSRRGGSSTATARAPSASRSARAQRPREAVTVCPCEPVIEAEVRYVLEHELARSVADVSRRTRLGLGACGGMRCAARCGQIVAEELEPRPARGHAPGARVPGAAGADALGRARPRAGPAGGAGDRQRARRDRRRRGRRRGGAS